MLRRFFLIISFTFLIFLPGLVFGDEFKSIHQLDWEKLKDKSGDLPREKSPSFRTTPCVNKEVVGFYNSYSSNYLSQIQWDLLTILAWFSVTANADGSLTNSSGWHWPEYAPITTAHSNSVKVVLTVTCFSGTTIGTILSTPSIRTTLINNLLTLVQNGNGDGVCIDFEGVPAGYKTQLLAFMTELNNTFKSANSNYHVSICTPAVDWNGVFDYDQLALNCDALFIMAYDYHWSSGPKAGPVAQLTSGSVWGTYNVTWTV
ncbi:MAG: glycosyl hydrolase family 18 protein, partial [bacterium]|nr:glycosyl hydrolase family 18 protein [bacterium]